MSRKILIIIFLTMLVLLSGLTNAITINNESIVKKNKNSTEKIKISGSGAGGWHSPITQTQNGKECSNIYKIGGNGGGWDKPFEDIGVRFWAEINRVRAEYTFDVNDGPVKYVTYKLEYKDMGLLSDGPDALIYKWDDTWDSKSNIAGVGNTEMFYGWKEYTFNQNGDKYVNNEGKIRVAAQAYDDDSWWHQDDIAVKHMRIVYETADEEIFQTDFNKIDTDDDGSYDSVDVSIDADVGDYGDGTTVEVTAICELINPNSETVDTQEVTWTIVDQQVDSANVTLCSLGSINGDYTINIVLKDEYGNEEDTESTQIYLEPDPQRTITFLTNEGGYIEFEGEIFNSLNTTVVSDGSYNINAVAFEYFVFDYWEGTDGVNVNDIYSATTTVEVTGDGTLTAYFNFTLNTVIFLVNPEDGGYINFGGYDFENNTGVYAESGIYEITAIANEPDYVFSLWEYTEGVVFQNDESKTTLVNVSGDAIILANFNLNEPPGKPQRPSGPTSGEINKELTFSTAAVDPNNDGIWYQWDWGDGTQSSWQGPFASGQTVTEKHTYTGIRNYDVKVKAKDGSGIETDWSDPLTVTISSRPTAPVISGPSKGKINQELEFSFCSDDLDGDDVYYYIEWGDGEILEWDGPHSSGEPVTFKHIWTDKDSFTIKAMSKDENGVVSEFSSFAVSMPRSVTSSQMILRLLAHFPNLLSVIQMLIRLG